MSRTFSPELIASTRRNCRTQWHIIVAHLWYTADWLPTHQLQKVDTHFGYIRPSGEQRVRELAVNSRRCPPDLHGKIEKKREGKYAYFRYNPRPALTPADRVRLFDAGAPAEQIFA